MGSCYSRKASGGSYSYTTVAMASTKQEDATRLARPTPYSRNNSIGGLSFKKKIPPLQSKQETALQNRGSGQQSNIPRLHSSFSSSGHLDTDELESNKKYVDPNSNSTDDLHFVNNNNNNSIVDDSDTKSEIAKLTSSVTRQGKRSLETSMASGNTDNFKYDANKTFYNMSKQNSDAIKISVQSKIPSVSTAYVSGLPRPQVAQISSQYSGKSTENIAKNTLDEEPKQKSFQRQSRNIPKWQTKYDSSDISDSCNHISPESNLDGDSYAAETWDSGLGSSINEKAKQEDAETLKDIEHFDSLEGSPVCQTKNNELSTNVTKVTNAISTCHISSDSFKNREDGKKVVKTHTTSTPKYKSKGGFGYSKSDIDGTFSQKFLSGASEIKLRNFSYDNQQTYAAYKSSLSYKRIPILRQYTESSRNYEDTKKDSSVNRDGSNIPRISRKVTNDGNKEKRKDTKIKAFLNSVSANKTVEADNSPKEILSPESDEKSDSTSQGILSPVSELENREFLIDDEIADQPGLISFANAKIPSLKQSVNELHVLQAANSVDCQDDSESFANKMIRDRSVTEGSLLSYSDMGSSSSSLASDDLMMDYEKSVDTVLEECDSSSCQTIKSTDKEKQQYRRSYPMVREEKKPLYRRSSSSFAGTKSSMSRSEWRSRSTSLPLRPPRQMAVTGVEDGSMRLDASSYRLLRQDLNGMKTMLLKLKRILHEAETLNPFDPNPKNMFYHSLAHIDLPSGYLPNSESIDEQHSTSEVAEVMQENTDLRRQLVLLQQQLEERERTVKLLQQQMTKYTKVVSEKDDTTTNAATQTERSRLWTSNLSIASLDDTSNGTLVSSEIRSAFDQHLEWTTKKHSNMKNQMEELTRSLSSINESLQTTAQKPLVFRSISSFCLHHST